MTVTTRANRGRGCCGSVLMSPEETCERRR